MRQKCKNTDRQVNTDKYTTQTQRNYSYNSPPKTYTLNLSYTFRVATYSGTNTNCKHSS